MIIFNVILSLFEGEPKIKMMRGPTVLDSFMSIS